MNTDAMRATLRNDGKILADRKQLEAVMACDPEALCRQQRKGGGVLGEPTLPKSALPADSKVGRDLRARRSQSQRRKLPHAVPAWVPQSARFFVTMNCNEKGRNTLCQDRVAQALLASARQYEETGRWYLWLVLIMPDHVPLIASFGPEHGLQTVVGQWKRYQARHHGIQWQANFFDHRLRNEDEFNAKAHYIRMNPVRKEFVISAEKWPFVLDRTDGVLGEPALPDKHDGVLGEPALPSPQR